MYRYFIGFKFPIVFELTGPDAIFVIKRIQVSLIKLLIAYQGIPQYWGPMYEITRKEDVRYYLSRQ